MEATFYSYHAKSLQGKDIKMSTFTGKVILVVNTASKCGLTPQYEGLEKLYQRFKDQGLIILGFPCNQFANQEPGNAKSISEGCLVNYGVTFPMFDKIDVNGPNAHPIYKYLKSVLKGFPGNKIKWNFGKFLLDRNGKPYKRFAPIVKPEKLAKHIEKLLKDPNDPIQSLSR
jgi:glutathione peroxidase